MLFVLSVDLVVEGLLVQLHSLTMDKFHAGLKGADQVFGMGRTYTPSDHCVQRTSQVSPFMLISLSGISEQYGFFKNRRNPSILPRHIYLNTPPLRLLSAIRINISKCLAPF